MSIQDVYPLSAAQTGMLMHTLEGASSDSYLVQCTLQFDFYLEDEALHASWQVLIRRHAIFRTAFPNLDERKVRQVVIDTAQPRWRTQDWSDRTPLERESMLEQLLLSDRSEGFVLERAPLLRLQLLRWGEQGSVLVWTYHHAISDGWSMPIVLSELMKCYAALVQGRQPQLAPARQYRDYIHWLSQQDSYAAEKYWRDYLKGFDKPTLLGSSSEAVQARQEAVTAPQSCGLTLEASMAKQIQGLARRERVTVNVVLQALWGVLLSRYSGERDVVFGTVVSGRPAELAGVEEIVGPFINTVVVRVRVGMKLTFIELMKVLHREQLARMEYEHCSLVDVQKWSAVPPGSALFDSIFVFENYPVNIAQRTDDAILAAFGRPERSFERPHYRISMVAALYEELSLEIKFDAAMNRISAQGMLQHFEQLLRQCLVTPEVLLSELSLLGETQSRRQVSLMDGPRCDFPERSSCVHELFRTQALRTPESIALVCGARHLSYAELEARSNRLAHYLIERGVGAEVLVGIFLERSVDLVVALLGILKAGGAYVPIDPKYPQDRIAYMLQDASVRILITQQSLRSALLQDSQVEMLCIDAPWDEMMRRSAEAPEGRAAPGNLAYVIYTSGSTGKPKGVMIEHQAAANTLLDINERLNLRAMDVLLGVSSISFDLSVYDIFGVLAAGAKLVIPQPAQTLDSEAWWQLVQSQSVTIWNSAPGLMTLYLDASAKRQAPALRAAMLSGDWIPLDLFNRLQESAPGCRLISLGGATEVSIWSVWFSVTQIDPQWRSVPYGRALTNQGCQLSDSADQLAPTHIKGDFHITGRGLARGYLNRPELTAEKFRPDPFGFSSRRYATGDVAIQHGSGSLELVGRRDSQIKIRGFRVELAEIETVLSAHPMVYESVVLPFTTTGPQPFLVAFVLPRQPSLWNPESERKLREHVLQRLPEYMVPARFVALERLPTNSNGKIDRDSLRKHSIVFAAPERYEPPATEEERVAAAIWQAVLGRDLVGVTDSFYELGGDSLTAIRVVARMNQALESRITLQGLFQTPTIAGLLRRRAEVAMTVASEKPSGVAPMPRIVAQTSEVNRSGGIFLTGMTGFLGSYLLREILRGTDAVVYCLVRPNVRNGSAEPLQFLERKYGHEFAAYRERIRLVPGDLTAVRFGMAETEFAALCHDVSHIFHNAAAVDFLQSYEQLAPVNVGGTGRIVEMAGRQGLKNLHFISTMSVFRDHDSSGCIPEIFDVNSLAPPSGGYAHSKWAAENVVVEASRQGVRASIFRPARIVGDAQTGQWNVGDGLCQFIRGIVEFGYYFEDTLDNQVPVDFASRAIVALAKDPQSAGKAFHLVNSRRTSFSLVRAVLQQRGHELQRVPYSEWLARLVTHLEADQRSPLHFFRAFFPEQSQEQVAHPGASHLLEERYLHANTRDGLAGTDILCPEITEELWQRYYSAIFHDHFSAGARRVSTVD